LLFSEVLQGDTLQLVSGCFQAFSSGTFLFVALGTSLHLLQRHWRLLALVSDLIAGEIIPKELAAPHDKFWKMALCALGFLGMSAIKVFDSWPNSNPSTSRKR
jgi:hypothetical protein